MKKLSVIWTLLGMLALLLSSCRTPAPNTVAPTTVDSNAVFTAAAATAGAILTSMVEPTGTPTPEPSDTPVPATQTQQPTSDLAVFTATATRLAGGSDNSAYVSETIPDGSDYAPGTAFLKTWEFKNTGTSTWTTGYSLYFVSGAQMGAPASIPLPYGVSPGQVVPVSVNLVAPNELGNYRGYWQLRNEAGQAFGVSVWVDIDVVAGSVTPGTPSGTSTAATATPTTSANAVSGVSLSVDNAAYSGTCPHIFTFIGQITVSREASVTYQLEAGIDGGGTVTVPAAVTATFPAGTHSVAYYLEFSNTLSGWAKLRISAPNEISSSNITYTLTCP